MQMNVKPLYSRAKEKVLNKSSAILQWVNNHKTLCFWLLGVFYRIALDLMYILVASVSFSYGGLIYAPNLFNYFMSMVLYFLIFGLLPKRESDTVGFLLHLQFALTVAPMLTFFALGNQSAKYMIMVAICVILQTLLTRGEIKESRACYIGGVKNYATIFGGVLLVVTIFIPFFYNGFTGLKAFNFSYIYEMRANAEYPMGFGYLLLWMTRTILPFAALLFLNKKKYLYFLAVLLIEILFYMLTGEKFILFILVPVVLIYFLSKTKHLIKLMYLGLGLVFVLVVFAYRFLGTTTIGRWTSSLVAVRTIFHPADNKFNFYEFFSRFPKIYFSDGLIGKMFGITYPYAGSVGQVVYAYTGGAFLSANMNTGYLGESYAQLGFLGMLLMSSLLALVLRALRHYDGKERFPILVALFSVYIIILNDSALFTTLFSGGVIIAMLLLMIYFDKNKERTLNGIQYH